MMNENRGSTQSLRRGADHEAEVLRLEREILEIVAAGRAEVLQRAARLVRERLAPVDGHAASVLLGEIRRGALP
jgi:hypothetical protein